MKPTCPNLPMPPTVLSCEGRSVLLNTFLLPNSSGHPLTIDDIFNYVEFLTESVEKQIIVCSSDSDKKSLMCLKELDLSVK